VEVLLVGSQQRYDAIHPGVKTLCTYGVHYNSGGTPGLICLFKNDDCVALDHLIDLEKANLGLSQSADATPQISQIVQASSLVARMRTSPVKPAMLVKTAPLGAANMAKKLLNMVTTPTTQPNKASSPPNNPTEAEATRLGPATTTATNATSRAGSAPTPAEMQYAKALTGQLATPFIGNSGIPMPNSTAFTASSKPSVLTGDPRSPSAGPETKKYGVDGEVGNKEDEHAE
jgi:hypothetical protein